ncbi:hypothetical protein TIFTF001_025300 [Ficus carica]|uniref:B3 domain-containing protein n=1 Tax=Ficus carica TaxID=3494 RepID=A0AA88DKJ1_FICCA|nr:hypothetical protein TIFTF001_025300 [Ficus carica]
MTEEESIFLVPPLPNIKEKSAVDLAQVLKFAPFSLKFPTKRRGTPGRPHPVLPLKKRPRLFVDKDDRKRKTSKKSGATRSKRHEEIKTEAKKETSTSTKRIRKSTKHSSKRRVIAGPDPAPPMPDNLMAMVVRDFNVATVTLVIQKSLFQTDLEKGENRFSMTLKQIASDDFLTEEEKRTLARRRADKHLESIEVDFVEPNKDLSKTVMTLRRWEFKNSSSYVLSHNWHNVAKKNKLNAGDIVQIWFFRSRERKPCFAVINLGQEPASCSSSAVREDDSEPTSDVTA